MIKTVQSSTTPYLQFNRKQWASLHNFVPTVTLSEAEVVKLKEINEDISIKEIIEIYLPLSHLLNCYINSKLHSKAVIGQLLGTNIQHIPYIIGITGSVAAGKSTTARVLQILLSRWPENRTVDLVTTDGFLYSNSVLKKLNLTKKKGFPESYNSKSLFNFILRVKEGISSIKVPVYSHLTYDIVPDKKKIIYNPDILILEGLNLLQNNIDHNYSIPFAFISDFIDFSIYIDAPEIMLRNWYISRFLKFCHNAFLDQNSYFHHYAHLPKQKTIEIANKLWNEINYYNLQHYILPTRHRARLILGKSVNHIVEKVQLRK